MRTVRVSIVRAISISRPLGWENAIAHVPQDRRTPAWAYPGMPHESAVGRARCVCGQSRGHTATSHPFAHAAHDVVFDRRRREVVEEGRPNQ
jgi:hypothetical protein